MEDLENYISLTSKIAHFPLLSLIEQCAPKEWKVQGFWNHSEPPGSRRTKLFTEGGMERKKERERERERASWGAMLLPMLLESQMGLSLLLIEIGALAPILFFILLSSGEVGNALLLTSLLPLFFFWQFLGEVNNGIVNFTENCKKRVTKCHCRLHSIEAK